MSRSPIHPASITPISNNLVIVTSWQKSTHPQIHSSLIAAEAEGGPSRRRQQRRPSGSGACGRNARRGRRGGRGRPCDGRRCSRTKCRAARGMQRRSCRDGGGSCPCVPGRSRTRSGTWARRRCAARSGRAGPGSFGWRMTRRRGRTDALGRW